MAELLKGAPVARALAEDVAQRVAQLSKEGISVCLALVRVGEKDADLSYERGIEKRCQACGIEIKKYVYTEHSTTDELMSGIANINSDDAISGCLLFRPLPAHIDEEAVCQALSVEKDVDGQTEGSLFGVFAGVKQGFPPCTAEAVMQILDFYHVDLAGKNVCVIGRSLVVGKPVSMMLQARNATVVMCHSKTEDLTAWTKACSVVVVAAGHPKTFAQEHTEKNQTVIDVGINWDKDAGKLVGDVDFGAVEPLVGALTPVPGGVGSVTTACLARHVVEAAERCRK
ncbi:MAG: bifunctional 5,10-methylenetetrahydrofolate dehydrogenase/5,10-methenyltetrahydrofolate cyclohydrolase [Atopobiaceae bacterium]|jgi:methylenetetrahydrofolate dehydrogenase (NADP+)/methenyltetrahydrofolate cyclohydrolase